MAGISSTIYNAIFRRNSVFLGGIFVGAFAFEMWVLLLDYAKSTGNADYMRVYRTFDAASNKIWDTLNRGRQWKDIRHQYINKEEDDDE